MEWFEVQNADQIPSPALIFYQERILANIQNMVAWAGTADRLVPHVKTHKNPEIVALMLKVGIKKFKCATLAEAEMLAKVGAKWILIAYQMVGPNAKILRLLAAKYPDVAFHALVDDPTAQPELHGCSLFLDVNVGMNRTGCLPEHIDTLLQKIDIIGLHLYDGHIKDSLVTDRKKSIQKATDGIIQNPAYHHLDIICGGTPTFSVYKDNSSILCSPGTCVLHDLGYQKALPEQPFDYAALVLTRVISKPSKNLITIDLGHKAIAAENPIGLRFELLNCPTEYVVVSQSEEHGVIEVPDSGQFALGQELYAVPYHICPTVNLYQNAYWTENQLFTHLSPTTARTRHVDI